MGIVNIDFADKFKKFLYGFTSVEYVGIEPEGWTSGTTYQLLSSHHRIQNLNPATVTILQLPSTGVVKGEAFTIKNRATTGSLSVRSSGGNIVQALRAAGATYRALVDSPTASTDWDIENYYFAPETVFQEATADTALTTTEADITGAVLPALNPGTWRISAVAAVLVINNSGASSYSWARVYITNSLNQVSTTGAATVRGTFGASQQILCVAPIEVVATHAAATVYKLRGIRTDSVNAGTATVLATSSANYTTWIRATRIG